MESLPLPEDQQLKILYELPIAEINKMAQTNSHFRNLITAPDFWDRKGQYLTQSVTIPVNPDTGHPFYGVRSWKEYLFVVEEIINQVDAGINRLKLMEEPDYRRYEDGEIDDDDLANRSPTLLISPKDQRNYNGVIVIVKQRGKIIAFSNQQAYTLYRPNKTNEKYQQNLQKIHSQIFGMNVGTVELTVDGQTIFNFHYIL